MQLQGKDLWEVLALLTSVWSMGEYYRNERAPGAERDVIRPTLRKLYPNQFIALYLMLANSSEDANVVQQIGTGEGKSIIMGFASSILALIGYEVHAVCYSSYLSERDYKSFEPLFKFLDLDDHIFYGTFNQISEVILQKQFDIRQKSVELIKSSYQLPGLNRDAQRKRQANKNRKSILIIDEVDVFFSEHFYGKTFNPVAPYSCDEIREILVTVYDRGYLQH